MADVLHSCGRDLADCLASWAAGNWVWLSALVGGLVGWATVEAKLPDLEGEFQLIGALVGMVLVVFLGMVAGL